MKNLSDERLVALFAQGKNEAFDELLYRYKDNLYSYIYTAVQNRQQTEDFFQDTFVKVIHTLKSGNYQEVGKFSGFVFRIAHNIIIDYYRQQQLAQVVKESDVDYDLFGVKDFSGSNMMLSREEDLSHDQVLSDVRRMIQYLPRQQRDIIVMRYYKNMSYKEIADELGVCVNTALGRMHYAVGNMRRLAEEHNISLSV